ncbi:MAG: zf-HC2 domain-containing protein, partial [Pyrinomonadaceae bacterium]|nr:zf-HC2 domain-containing protein [Pyrinomonadaceae bacterium]
SDYLEGILDHAAHREFSEHALRCPVCHQTLSEVKNTMQACRVGAVPQPSREFEARILKRTMPESVMTCQEFEDSLTDYLDGFLPAPFYHRWERHAALCDRCTELPGEVVRSIGACYTYISEEMPVPVGLEDRILEATIGTQMAGEVRAPWSARLASRLRIWLDPIVSPQLARVAVMSLVAVFVLAHTVSADGSISGVYRAGVRLAAQSYSGGTEGGIKEITKGLKGLGLVGGQDQDPKNNSGPGQKPADQKPQAKPEGAGDGSSEKKP